MRLEQTNTVRVQQENPRRRDLLDLISLSGATRLALIKYIGDEGHFRPRTDKNPRKKLPRETPKMILGRKKGWSKKQEKKRGGGGRELVISLPKENPIQTLGGSDNGNNNDEKIRKKIQEFASRIAFIKELTASIEKFLSPYQDTDEYCLEMKNLAKRLNVVLPGNFWYERCRELEILILDLYKEENRLVREHAKLVLARKSLK